MAKNTFLFWCDDGIKVVREAPQLSTSLTSHPVTGPWICKCIYHSPSKPLNPTMKVNRGTKQEHVEILLFLERRALVPHTHEAYVDAAPHVVEIVYATPVELVPEKVAEDLEVQCVE